MRIYLLFTIFLLHFFSAQGQSFFIKSGKNFTEYKYYNSEGVKSLGIGTDVGDFHEFGVAFSFKKFRRFTYELSALLNEYNAIVVAPNPAIKYKTQYLGLGNAILFSIIKSKHFVFDAKTGVSVNTIIQGRQDVEGVIKDLKDSREFNELLFMLTLGVQAKVIFTPHINLSLGFDYQYSYFDPTVFDSNVKVTKENLFFNNKQVKFGIYILLDQLNSQSLNIKKDETK